MLVGIAFPVLVMVVGLLIYLMSSNAKVVEVGRILFFAGALVTTWLLPHLPK